MNQETGRFENLNFLDDSDGNMVRIKSTLQRINPQYDPGKHQDPCLSIGEIVEIKHVKFRVTRIKADGKLGLKMLNESECI